jgi:hypothetical protein
MKKGLDCSQPLQHMHRYAPITLIFSSHHWLESSLWSPCVTNNKRCNMQHFHFHLY